MKYLVFTLTLVFFAVAEETLDDKGLVKELQTLQKAVPGLPGLPDLLAGLPSIDEGEEALKEKCMKTGNNETYEKAVEANSEFQACVKSLVNVEVMMKEIKEAKPTGDLDSVFRKYCQKTPTLRECISNFTDAMAPCLDPNEIAGKNIALNLSDSLMKFICHNDGDRIALFIAEGGQECLESNVKYVQSCWNESFVGTDLNTTNPNSIDLLLDEEKCSKMNQVQNCIVKHLEKCSEPTPANVINSMFEFVKKKSPCYQYDTDSSSLVTSSVHYIVFFVFVSYLFN
ncbi:27 kDa glycoprotein-like [Cimex lectularius]|uniref:27 kDa hemolymph protein n=1 Tax=Cimex lectularius TaxID=79782 RepID=A0A8I6RAX8_CIMLE|nr:27 kDa glycoprotein-like [Cimex lectularius]